MEKIAVFEGRKIRRRWDEKQGKWYFSVVDIIQTLIQQANYQTARKYWNKLKERLKKEGNESVSNCHQLKFEAMDGKFYLTDAELSTRQIAENMQAKGLEKNKIPAKKGGRIAKNARLELEQKTGKKVVRGENFKLPIKDGKQLDKWLCLIRI